MAVLTGALQDGRHVLGKRDLIRGQRKGYDEQRRQSYAGGVNTHLAGILPRKMLHVKKYALTEP
jgi:hypothetical protein